MSKEILEGFKKFRTRAVEIGNFVINAEREYEQKRASVQSNFDHWSYRDYYDFQFSDTNAVSVDLYPVDDKESEEFIELTEQDSDDETKMIDFPVRYFYEDYKKEISEKYEIALTADKENQKLIEEKVKKLNIDRKIQKKEEEYKLYLELKEKYEKENS